MTLELAASGPKAASQLAPGIDGLVLGGGLSVPWTRRLWTRPAAAGPTRSPRGSS